MFKIIPTKVYGFCKGVDTSIRLAEDLLASAEGPVYSIGDLVHNKKVVEGLEDKGLEVIEGPSGHGPGKALVRAHGITSALWREFEDAGFELVDGTCKIVLANHRHCARAKGPVLYFGGKTHPETIGTVDKCPGPCVVAEDPSDLDNLDTSHSWDVVMQTTLPDSKAEALLSKLDSLGATYRVLSRPCPASRRRRDAVLDLCGKCDLVVVVGEERSSNTRALREIALSRGVRAVIVRGPEDVTAELVGDAKAVGLTGGASAAPLLVSDVAKALEGLGGEAGEDD